MSQQSFSNARFVKSAAAADGFVDDDGCEVAVVGRSNSGKSSAINAILGRGGLARVSKTPGRTQLVNFFEIGAGQRLVDLPGYGFARVPDRVRAQWGKLMSDYFESRQSLRGLVVTVDIRRGIGEHDEKMLDWAESLSLPLLLLATKADKLSRGAAASTALAMRQAAPAGAVVTVFSSPRKLGVEEARRQLQAWLAGSEVAADTDAGPQPQ